MKILLIGDYSGVHSELTKVLRKKNLDVKLISDGDGYKGFACDVLIKYDNKYNKSKIYNLYLLISEFLGTKGILSFYKKWKILKNETQGFDVVQIINPIALTGFGSMVNLFFLYFLKKNNKKIFLCALGDDYYWVKSSISSPSKFRDLSDIHFYNFLKRPYSTKYTHGFLYKTLNNYAIKISTAVIPGLYDYQQVYLWCNKITRLVPLPISDENIGTPIKIQENEKIVIFHGWQIGKESRKGNLIFDSVAKRLCADFPEKIEYLVVKSVPFEEYTKLYQSAHIAFDQCFSCDKGVNGLIHMAAGKVSITGFEKEALMNYPHYNPDKIYGINSSSNKNYLYNQLKILIENPKKIEEISENAIEFVKQNHNNTDITNLYLQIWGFSNLQTI